MKLRRRRESLAEAGFREVVLTGIHLTSYGRDAKDGTTLLDAIRAAHDVPGIARVRLGSLEPVVVTPEFVEGIKGMPKVCHQFHLALQSGSDTVLARMHRRYTSGEFLDACAMLREAFEDCALTTDVMTGFPGETEAELAQTKDTCTPRGVRADARLPVFRARGHEGRAHAGQRAEAHPRGTRPRADRAGARAGKEGAGSENRQGRGCARRGDRRAGQRRGLYRRVYARMRQGAESPAKSRGSESRARTARN